MRVVSLNAGQVGDTVVPSDHENKAQHDPNAEVYSFVRHRSDWLPGVLTGIVTFHAAEADQPKGLVATLCTDLILQEATVAVLMRDSQRIGNPQ